ncbi:MAG: aminomethyl-transferring glycine dehydrogenase subunit GcvPA [Candidatus Aminicenantes bacterium]|nr:aminomethyl-transferring glycine dehydrogenase subunit GcvPA [Candidatus Aminicenantes bacterium]
MKKKADFVHPYIPNSVRHIKDKMLREIGVETIEDLYKDIPEELRFKEEMKLPPPITSECRLERHIKKILGKNLNCEENLSFLGGGCTRHHVPAICDEINRRSEFLTAYAGEPYEDHGRFQALFEYQSLMAELLDMDVVNVPTYDWCQSAGTVIRMAERITGREKILVSAHISPERSAAVNNYCRPVMDVISIAHDSRTGWLDLEDLRSKMDSGTAGFYFENPSYLGILETQVREIADIIHGPGGLVLTGVDPISLGVIAPPVQYGADIVCGDIQSLGIHMNYGGGQGGFIATRDEEKFVMEYPSRLFGITKTMVEGELGFGDVAYERTSFGQREKGKEFVGTHAALWGITAAVYLSLMGPKGMTELGKNVLQKAQYTAKRLSALPGVAAPRFEAPFFKEFTVDFSGTGLTVKKINDRLLKEGIFGGIDLSGVFPECGQSALLCLTEQHTLDDIERLVRALAGIFEGEGRNK